MRRTTHASSTMTPRASVGNSIPGGQRGGEGGGATARIYYCFECDAALTIAANPDSEFVCPNCGHVVLEEFETPSSSPPPPTPPLPRSLTVIDPFFPTSDTDSDIELSDPLPPPPPPPLPSLRNYCDLLRPLYSEFRPLQQPCPPPPVLDRCPRFPQFPEPSAPIIDHLFFSSSRENGTSHFDSELDSLWPPPPPPPLPEHLLRSPPVSPSSSSQIGQSFYAPSTGSEEGLHSQPMTSLIQLPPPPAPPPRPLQWDYFFPPSPESELDSPNHQRASQLQPPPPPPWLQPPPKEGLLDMKMTVKLVSEWKCQQCSICIDNFELNQTVKLTPCKHLYHSACILRWLDLHKSCPVCRKKLPSV